MILLFDVNLGEDKVGQLIEKIEGKIKENGGDEIKTDKWGVKRLASMLNRSKTITQANYVFIRFRSQPALPAELSAFLKVNESILRYFLSRAVKAPAVPAAAPEATIVGEIKGEPLGEPK